MTAIYNIMNIGNQTPVLSGKELNSYPPVCEELVMHMEDLSLQNEESVYIFPMIRKNLFGQTYIDIYTFDSALSFSERFVLAPGYKLADDKEERLEANLKSKCITYHFSEKNFIEKMKQMAEPYLDNVNSVSRLLLGFYFISYRSGLRELLFKSQLDYLGFYIEKFNEIDLSATNPKDLFGLPVKVLRLFNCEQLYSEIVEPVERELTGIIYKRFSSLLSHEKHLTDAQWKYLAEVRRVEKREHIWGYKLKFRNNIFKELGEVKSVRLQDKYLEYIILKELVEEGRRKYHLPKRSELEDRLRKLRQLYKYQNDKEYLDWGIKRQSKENKHLEYQNYNYRVRVPKSFDEIINQSNEMRNCICDYIEEIAEGDTIILFVDIKDEHNMIAMEIDDGKIVQALRKFNDDLTDRDEEFLYEYCEARGLEHCL